MNLPKATLRKLCHTCKYKNGICVECILTAGRRRGDDDQHQQEMLMMSPPRHYLSSSSSSSSSFHCQEDFKDCGVIGHDVQRKEESFPDYLHGKINDESLKQQKKLVDSILSFFFGGGVIPSTLFSHRRHHAVLVIICILWSLFFMTPAFYSYSYSTSDTASVGNIDTSMNDFVQYYATTEQQQQHKQVEKRELNFLAWVAMVYTVVLLMVAVEGIWVDQFRRGAAGYKNNNTVSIKIHHDTLIKVIGWSFAGGSIMFMVWGVQFVVLD